MAELKTTPGPWEIFRDGATPDTAYIRLPKTSFGEKEVAVLYSLPNEANARLIAAAPDLYEAADELLGALADVYSHLQKTAPERLVLPIREAGNKLAYAMRKVEVEG